MAKLGVLFVVLAVLATCALSTGHEQHQEESASISSRVMASLLKPKNRKPECGKQTPDNRRCSKKKCCSKYGYCGTHTYHCSPEFGCQSNCLTKGGKKRKRGKKGGRKKPVKVVKKKKYPTKTIVKTISTPIPVCKNCNKVHRTSAEKHKDLAKAIKLAIKKKLVIPVKSSESTSSSTSVSAKKGRTERRPSCELKGTCGKGRKAFSHKRDQKRRGSRSRGRGRGGKRRSRRRGKRNRGGSRRNRRRQNRRRRKRRPTPQQARVARQAKRATGVLKHAQATARKILRRAKKKARKHDRKIGRQRKTVMIKAAPIMRKKAEVGPTRQSTITYNVAKPVDVLDPKGY